MAHALELKIPPLLALAIFVAIVIGIASLAPLRSFNVSFTGRYLASALLAIAGAATAVAGVIEFRRSKTTVNPLTPQAATTVVASGIFTYSRNPMYVGMALVLLAVVVLSGSVVALVCVPAFCAYLTQFQIKPEERMLEQVFGTRYAVYMTEVRRWL